MNPVKVTIASTMELGPALMDFARAASGVAGQPASNVAAAMKAVEAQLDAALPGQAQEAAEAMRASLPAGVRLVSLTQARAGLDVTSSTTLELDDLGQLGGVKMFEGFVVQREGEHVSVRGTAPDARVALSIEGVTEAKHNATRVDGARLVWEGRAFEVQLSAGVRGARE